MAELTDGVQLRRPFNSETQNVLDRNYTPIPSLYATENCCSSRFGPMYTTPTAGLSIGMCVTLGREAGKESAK